MQIRGCWPMIVAMSLLIGGQALHAEVRFSATTLDDDVEIGYGLAIGDVDGDGRDDILLADKREFVWFQNPGPRSTTWTRHLMVRDLTPRDNVCLAARDLDGDGRVEVAVGANWNPSETSDVALSGAVFYLQRPPEANALWRAIPIRPYDPTTHRMHWVRWQPDDFRLVVLPLHGRGNRNGAGVPVRVMAYKIPLDAPEQATAEVIYEAMHMTHNFDVEWAADNQAEVLWLAGREGIAKVSATEQSLVVPSPPSAGAGEVRRAHITPIRENLVTIEPMHGTHLVFYEHTADGQWRRQVLDNSFNQGHGLAAADLLGLGRDQVVAGWRNPNADNRVGIRLYVPNPEANHWDTYTVDDNDMACEDLKVADLDGDGRLDIIAAGRATNNLVIYWNDSTEEQPVQE